MYPCADGATALPEICGGISCIPANFVDVAQEAIETGTLPPAVRHTTQITSCYGLGLRPQFPPRKDRLLTFSDACCACRGAGRVPGASTNSLGPSKTSTNFLQKPPKASRTLQAPGFQQKSQGPQCLVYRNFSPHLQICCSWG